MKTTDVVHSFLDAGMFVFWNFYIAPLGTSCRLYSFTFRPYGNPSGNGYTSLMFKDGGASGDIKFQFGYRVVDADAAGGREAMYLPPAVSIPSRGIRFDDGIYLDQGLGDSSGVGGLVSWTATVQGTMEASTQE